MRAAIAIGLCASVLGCGTSSYPDAAIAPACTFDAAGELVLVATDPTPHFASGDLARGAVAHVRLATAASLDAPTYAGAIEVTSSDTGVLEATASGPGAITIRAAGVGSAVLRVIDPTAGCALLARGFSVETVQSIAFSSFASAVNEPVHYGHFGSIWAGTTVGVQVELLGGLGYTWLGDDSAHVEGQPPRPNGTGFTATLTSPAEGTLEVSVVRDAETRIVSVPVVSRLDSIDILAGGPAFDTTPRVLCVHANGPRGIVAGAPIVFALPSILVEDPSAAPSVNGVPDPSCIGVRGVAAGSGLLSASLGDVHASAMIVVAIP